MLKPRSTTLFHFTKTLDTLKSILKNGFYPRYSLEDIGWLIQERGGFIALPIVCFCDIPLSRIIEHVEFYGLFGIGMNKIWALSNGLNPIIYVSEISPLAESLRNNAEIMIQMSKAEQKKKYVKNMRYTVAYSKPISGTMIVAGKPVTKEFYQELEWRYVAQQDDIEEYLRKKEFNDPAIIEEANNVAAEKARLQFSPKDVKYLLVKSDADIPDLVNFIDANMDKFSSSDLKVLTTRIISLDTIQEDM